MIATPLPSNLDKKVLNELSAILGEQHVLSGDCDRIAYSRDCFPKMLIWARSANFPHPPDAVCLPENEEELSKVLVYLHQKKIPIIPYGGGSGVAGGTLPV